MSTDINLTNCDREPIHIPGAILPHGAMLVLDPVSLVILQVAGDVQGLVGASAPELIGRFADTLFRADQVARVRALATALDLKKPRHVLDPLLRIRADFPLDVSLHLSGGALVLEFEAADTADRFAADPLTAVQEMIAGFGDAGSLLALCHSPDSRASNCRENIEPNNSHTARRWRGRRRGE
jgi:light-regulated signal transduction histidine kinase (bacteriophytochrome)